MRQNTSRLLAFFFAALAPAATACGGGKAPAPDAAAATTAPDAAPAGDAGASPDAAVAETTPPAPASRMPDAKAFFEKALDVGGIEGAIALADALDGEAKPEAKLAAGRIRLVAVARDMAAAIGAGEGNLKMGLDAAKAQLDKLVSGGTDAAFASDDGKRVQLAARALRRMLGDTGVETPDALALRALETDAHPEGAAYRLAVLADYARMREVGSDTIGLVVAPVAAVGPYVCTGCGQGFSADIAAKPAADGSGLKCAAAGDARWCKALLAIQAKDPIATQPENALVIAALELATRIAAVDPGSADNGPLAAAINALSGFEPAVLPVPVVLPADAPTLGTGTPSDMAESTPALTIVQIGPDAAKIGVRAVVAPSGPGGLEASLASAATGAALADAPALTFDALAKAEPAKDTGAIPGVTDRLGAVRDAIGKAPSEGAGMLPGDRAAVEVAIDPAVPVAAVEKIADGIAAGTSSAVRVLRPGLLGEVLPLFLRAMPAELEASLVPAWDKTMVVVVGKDAIDVWAPEGPKEGGKAIGPDAADKVPAGLAQGWRKDVLARLRVPIPPAPAPRVGPDQLKGLEDAVKLFSGEAKAGRVVHVIAGDGATTMDVLTVARDLQEGGLDSPAELARVGDIWPGARCRGEGWCADAVAVAFSKRAPPSSRGLTDKPGKGDDKSKEPKKEPEPKGPAPSPEFCNQGDIKSNMAKKAGSFRFCYERELQLDKDLAGRVVMNFVIGLDGAVKSVRVASSDLKNAKVGECIAKEIGKIHFKSPDGGECAVQWPFKFTAD